MKGTRGKCWDAFKSKFFEIYRRCKREKRKMVFADFKESDISECH